MNLQTIPDYSRLSLTDATRLQLEMKGNIAVEGLKYGITTIAGADISHNKSEETVYAGIVVLSYPRMEVLGYSLVVSKTSFPYVPGYLGFREVPALLEAWEQLPQKPDLMVLDGQGITHPRRMGIASHFGLLANCAAIGCAKNMLHGKFPDLGEDKFSASPITAGAEQLGYALRTKKGVKPVYISPGNKVSVLQSLEIMKECTGIHRIPEPTRLAHNAVNLLRTGQLRPGYQSFAVQMDLFS